MFLDRFLKANLWLLAVIGILLLPTCKGVDLTAPSVAGDQRFRKWWTRYQRLSVPMGLVSQTYEWFQNVDLRHLLASVTTPTRVIAFSTTVSASPASRVSPTAITTVPSGGG